MASRDGIRYHQSAIGSAIQAAVEDGYTVAFNEDHWCFDIWVPGDYQDTVHRIEWVE